MSNSESTDKIEKKVLLNATRARVWGALADSASFGTWFGMRFDGPFVEGKRMEGSITPTKVDDDVARKQAPHEGVRCEMTIEKIVPEQHFSFRWHPFAIDRDADYTREPTTLIVFELSDAPGGTLLTLTESGFDSIPLERRAKAFASNEGGWALQMRLIERYLVQTA
jgi:uncharacterized protein YndB with AHSA1/START domain